MVVINMEEMERVEKFPKSGSFTPFMIMRSRVGGSWTWQR